MKAYQANLAKSRNKFEKKLKKIEINLSVYRNVFYEYLARARVGYPTNVICSRLERIKKIIRLTNMKLIITEKNIAAQKIAQLLAEGKSVSDKVYNTPVYRFKRAGEDCVTIGLRGHIMEVDFPKELVYSKKAGWQAVDDDGVSVQAQVPKQLPVPPWDSKRQPYTEKGILLNKWKIPALPYLVYAPVIKLPKEKDIIRSLRNLAKKADSIIIATDFDREGELIGLDALELVANENTNAPISRARYSALIKREIENAFTAENLAELDFHLASAGASRRDIDIIWGAVLTRYLSLVKRSGNATPRSAGRVQTPTLALIVDREKERQAFVPEDYWVVSGKFNLQNAKEDDAFKGVHVAGRFKDEQEALEVMSHIENETSALVVSIEKKRRTSAPPAPFNTTSLMAAASSVGIKPARTMRIAESLYMNGFISYPRVDNTVYPAKLDFESTLKMLAQNPVYRPYAQELLKKDKLTPTRGKQKTTDHPPIHPTGLGDPDKLKPEEWKLYNLIARRFMATLSDAAVIEGTKVEMSIAGELFNAKGDALVEPGYRAIYQYGMKKSEAVPVLEQGQILDFSDPLCEHKQTEPPARYSSGKLIQEMEKRGLGTKATRHDMIEKLIDRNYVVNDSLEPTQLGIAIIEALEKYAPHITTPAMTAELEEEMNQIADGKQEKEAVVMHSRDLLSDVMEQLIPRKDEVADVIKDAVIADSRVGACPKCGGDLCIKSSMKTRGQFVGCINWPECDVTYPLPPNARYEATEEPCPVCGGVQVIIKPWRAKAFNHCLDINCASNQTPDVALCECPTCKKNGLAKMLYVKTNPRTHKRYIRCENYDECETSYPMMQRGEYEATNEYCDECGAPLVLYHTSRGPWKVCVNMECPKRENSDNKPARKKNTSKKA